MGEVYKARDTRLGREVAVKILLTTFSSDRDRLRRFEQEARALFAPNGDGTGGGACFTAISFRFTAISRSR